MMTSRSKLTADSYVWFPFGHLDREEAALHQKRLTCFPKSFNDEEVQPVKGYVYDAENERVGFPIAYVDEHMPNEQYSTNYNAGEQITITERPAAREDAQRRVWAALSEYMSAHTTALLQAPTGFGKTVTACDVIAERQSATVVIVTTTQLAIQWRDEIKTHLDIDAAIVASKTKSEGDPMTAPVVIILVHQLCMKREKSQEFYDRFGLAVWDECHRLGAREFSQSLQKFSAINRLALSATPRRKDGCENMFLQYFGQPAVVATVQTMPCNIYTLKFTLPQKTTYRYYKTGYNMATLLSSLSVCEERNEMIADNITRAYHKDRNVLALSDRIDQLGIMKRILIDNGVDEDDIGIIAGDEHDPVNNTRRKITQKEIDHTKKNAQIVLATYGMAKEGLDIPRLDMGIDMTPRADGEQALGRIRRSVAGKKCPIWLTVLDQNVKILNKYFHARMRDYKRADATLKNYGR
mgnify:CR=1 FL=1